MLDNCVRGERIARRQRGQKKARPQTNPPHDMPPHQRALSLTAQLTSLTSSRKSGRTHNEKPRRVYGGKGASELERPLSKCPYMRLPLLSENLKKATLSRLYDEGWDISVILRSGQGRRHGLGSQKACLCVVYHAAIRCPWSRALAGQS